jgi:ribonuclease BN (tRNA processing enzyme)
VSATGSRARDRARNSSANASPETSPPAGWRTVALGRDHAPLQVRFVGSGDAFGSGGPFQACILLHAPGHSGDVLLDCGASSLIAVKQQRHDPSQIGLVLVSHLHGDHFGGLPFLVLDGQLGHRTRPLHVAGPAGWESGCRRRWRTPTARSTTPT